MWQDLRDYKILEGDCIQKMKEIESCSIDAIVTDPPYGIGFMGKKWDCSVPGLEWARECLRVLKPGGHIIAFSSTRTVHRLGVAIEDAGFEIRDTIHWCYFSGFPKSHDISKAIDKEAGAVREIVGKHPCPAKKIYKGGHPIEDISITTPATKDAQKWQGYGTALKPAIEPAILARKPIEKGLTIAQNVLKYGTGAINIDDCRFGYGDPCWVGPHELGDPHRFAKTNGGSFASFSESPPVAGHKLGRWPANLYQCSKPSRAEKEAGLDHLQSKTRADITGREEGSSGLLNPRSGIQASGEIFNFHPTVKPIKLMRWLCRLIGGKKGATILDPFCGSGTTGCAAILEGYDFIGIEITSEYLPIIKGRLEWAKEEYKRENAQLNLFEDAV